MTTPSLCRLLPALVLIALIAACSRGHDHGHGHGHADGHGAPSAAEEFERGPRGGRLLRNADFALEMTIYEDGVPPQYRLYAYRDDKPLAPETVDATVELSRLGGRIDRFRFTPEGDALVGDGTVVEPHSFDVRVVAREGGREHRFEYASYEGRTTIAPEVAQAQGIRTERAGPGVVRSTRALLGTVRVDGNRVARVRARFPGIVREVRVGLGDTVARGAVLALVEGNESMRAYPVTAPIGGVVTARETNVGDVTGDAPLFELADLSSVWVDLNVFGDDVALLRPGQPVRIASAVGDLEATARIERVLPIAVAGSQSTIARVRLPNPDGRWRPGLAVSAEVTLGESQVPLAVRTRGLQPFRDFTVVYARFGDTYEVRMLEIGAQDPDYTEVLGGLEPGTEYVTEQAFLVRADVEKSGASHDH